MCAKPQESTSSMTGNWTISTWVDWGKCWGSGGKTESLTLMSSTRPAILESLLRLWGHSSDGLAMWPECPARDCQNNVFLVSWKTASKGNGSQKALQGYPERLLKGVWIWPEKLVMSSSGPACLEKKSPGGCYPLWELGKLLCYVEELAVQICQDRTRGCASELYTLPDLLSGPEESWLRLLCSAICALTKSQHNEMCHGHSSSTMMDKHKLKLP